MNPLRQVVAQWHEYHPIILGYLRKQAKDETIAQELSQEVFLKTYRSSLNPDYHVTNIRSWLFEVAYHVFIDLHRQQKTICLCSANTETLAIEQEKNTYQEMADYVRPLLACLPETYTDALALELDGIPQKEIAYRLRLDLPAAKSRIQRSRKKMLVLIYECFHLDLDPQGRIESFAVRPDCVTLQSFLNEQKKSPALHLFAGPSVMGAVN